MKKERKIPGLNKLGLYEYPDIIAREHHDNIAKVRDAAIETYRDTYTVLYAAEKAYSDAMAQVARLKEIRDAAQSTVVTAKEAVHVAERQVKSTDRNMCVGRFVWSSAAKQWVWFD